MDISYESYLFFEYISVDTIKMTSRFLASLPTLGTYKMEASISNEYVDTEVNDSYEDDYDILDLHKKILLKFNFADKSLSAVRSKLELTRKKLDVPLSGVERKAVLRSIASIEIDIDKVQNSTEKVEYLRRATDLISLYSSLGVQVRRINFGSKIVKEKESSKNSILRSKVISEYLNIARDYISINIMKESEDIMNCFSCGSSLEEIVADETCGSYHCSTCGLERDATCSSFNLSISSKANLTRNNYEDRDNFFKAVRRYQGKQSNRIPESLYESLDTYFSSYCLPTSSVIKKRPLDKSGRREGSSRALLFRALFDINRSAYYEDVNLIGHIYWGWVLPDVSNLEVIIMEDYDLSQKIFERIKNERKSCLNSQYRLFKHLQRLGHPCSDIDFKIITTRDIIEYHECVWRQICDELHWEFIPTI